MSYAFLLLFFTCIFGVFRPFKNIKRWQFGLAAFVSLMLVGVTAPNQQKSGTAAAGDLHTPLAAADVAALEKKNAVQIADLKKEADKLPTSDLDGNLRIYKRLAELAPANTGFSEKRSFFEGKIAARSRYEDHPEEALTVEDFDWGTGGFGSVMTIDRLVVSNDAPFPIKDFTLKCVHQGHSGTDMDSNTRTIFEIVPANGKKTVRDINMGFISSQAATSRCEIDSAVKA